MGGKTRTNLLHYGAAVCFTALAVILRFLLSPLLDDRQPFITLFASVAFAAWFGGRGPALLALIAGAFVGAYLILPPPYTFAIDKVEDQAGLFLYFVVGLAFIVLFESLHNALRRAEEKQRQFEREISARRVAEKVLADREELLRITFAGIGDAVITTDACGNIASLNAVAQSLTGWAQDEAAGLPLRTVFAIVNEDTRQPVECPALRALREGVVVGLANHTVLIAKDETERPIDDSAAPIKNERGEIVGAVLVFRDVTERRRSEQEIANLNRDLHRRVAEFRTLLDVIPIGIAVAEDPDCRHVWTNPALSRILRLSPEANVSLSAPPKERPGFKVYEGDRELSPDQLPLQVAISTGQAVSGVRHDLLLPDGSWVNLLQYAVPLRDEQGHIRGGLYVGVDITGQERTQKALRDAERRFEAVFNQQFQFMVILAPDGTVLSANETCFRATGVERDKVLGHPLWETPWWDSLPAMQERWKCHVSEAAESGGPVTCEMEYSLADGSLRHAAVVLTGLKDELGRVTGVVVEGRDDTERKRSEAMLADQKRVLELLIGGAPLPEVLDALCEVVERQSPQKPIATVLLLDEDGQRLRSVAGRRAPPDYARAIDGVSIGPCIGSCGTAAYKGERVIVSDIASDPLWEAFKDLALGHGLRACWSTPVFSSQGKVLGTFAVYYPAAIAPSPDDLLVVDILARTAGVAVERRRDEEALRQADRRKDEFLATLAHELRNPLAPIRNGLQVLRLSGPTNGMVAEARSMMERQLAQMVRLVDDLMDVSRISRGKLELKMERVTLAEVVNGAVETSRPLIEQMEHELTVALPTHPVILNGDPTRLAQVVLNLLNNAAKYTERGGQIRLAAELQGGNVLLSVRDTGIGIAADHLPRIFEMFSQMSHALERSQGGLGIGLTLVKRLVEMHGGGIEARSDGPGKGAEFVVRLPVVVETSGPSTPDAEESAGVRPSLRILVVDDNRDNADSLSEILRIIGHDIRTAYEGEEAVATAVVFQPDVILLDIGLPKLNGYQACRRIRELPWAKRTIVIAQTGWGQEKDRQRTREAGFDHHLVKPVDPTVLVKLLSGLQGAEARHAPVI